MFRTAPALRCSISQRVTLSAGATLSRIRGMTATGGKFVWYRTNVRDRDHGDSTTDPWFGALRWPSLAMRTGFDILKNYGEKEQHNGEELQLLTHPRPERGRRFYGARPRAS